MVTQICICTGIYVSVVFRFPKAPSTPVHLGQPPPNLGRGPFGKRFVLGGAGLRCYIFDELFEWLKTWELRADKVLLAGLGLERWSPRGSAGVE